MSMKFDTEISKQQFGFKSEETLPGFSSFDVAVDLGNRSDIHPLAVKTDIDSGHVFESDFLSVLQLWWEWHDTSSPLHISGPAGCGKTTTVLQFLARVNMPAVNITCRQSMDMSDLLGRWGTSDMGPKWYEGPLTVAWKYGYTLVINEFSLAPAHVWVALNDIFEGGELPVDALGASIAKHPNTRIVITDNCRALDISRDYIGRRPQDLTSAERFWHFEAHWPEEGQEKVLLKEKAVLVAGKRASNVPEETDRLIEAALAFAGQTREDALNPEKPIGQRLPAISTRVLIRFVELTVAMICAERFCQTSVLDRALKLAIAKGLSPQKETMLLDLMHAHFDRLV